MARKAGGKKEGRAVLVWVAPLWKEAVGGGVALSGQKVKARIGEDRAGGRPTGLACEGCTALAALAGPVLISLSSRSGSTLAPFGPRLDPVVSALR